MSSLKIKKGDTAWIVEDWDRKGTAFIREIEVTANGKKIMRGICKARGEMLEEALYHYYFENWKTDGRGIYATNEEAQDAAIVTAQFIHDRAVSFRKRELTREDGDNRYGHLDRMQTELDYLLTHPPRVITYYQCIEETNVAIELQQ